VDLLDRCLRDGRLPVDVRAAGALLLYGLPISRIIELRRDQVAAAAGHHHLTIDKHRTMLPPAVGRLLDVLPARMSAPSLVARDVDGWLFPGRHPGQPISAGGMRRRLHRHGFAIRAARNAALISLAGDLPPAVLAELLGISLSNAVQWARRAARDWTPYLQARAHALADA
jgi:hypothetical protein